MTDLISPEKRSELMAKIKSKNTKPEILVRKFLFSKGYRYRLHDITLPTSPDIVLKRYKTVIFVNGCFWHGHKSKSCKSSHIPKTNKLFWQNKIKKNIKRDLNGRNKLRSLGWQVIVIWECQLRKNKIEKSFEKLIKVL